MKKHANAFLSLSEEAKQHINEVSVDGLSPDAILIDVREDHEWNRGHIPHAIHLGRGIIERDIKKHFPKEDTPLVLYCGGGHRSALAALNLQKMGYTHILSLAGGYRAWKQSYDVVVPAYHHILEFWFEDIDSSLWWKKDEMFDAEIKNVFYGDFLKAKAGHYDHWLAIPEGRLALIILLDQLSRNIFRNTPAAFAQDALALAIAMEGVSLGHDKALIPKQRVFFYMPYEHSEDNAMQEESIRLFSALAEADEKMKGFVDFAHAHKKVIDEFGRYPHRNSIVDRESTAQEKDYLEKEGSGF